MPFGFFLLYCLFSIKVTCVNIRAICFQQKLDGLHKVKAFQFLHEADDVTTFATAKTLIHVEREVKHQRGCLLIMEDTTALLAILAGILEGRAWT